MTIILALNLWYVIHTRQVRTKFLSWLQFSLRLQLLNGTTGKVYPLLKFNQNIPVKEKFVVTGSEFYIKLFHSISPFLCT